VEKSFSGCVPMQLSLGIDPQISVSDITRGYKRICGKENQSNLRMEEDLQFGI
jgi:hypothetical protein